MNLLILVVLYNLSPDKSQTLISLKKISGVFLQKPEVYVWINSSEWSEGNQDELNSFLSEYRVSTKHTPENVSLSHIYNTVFNKYSLVDRIVILDHDTSLTESYFNELFTHARISDDLIIPQVISGGRLVSPGSRFFSKGYLKNSVTPGVQQSRNVLAINSGMAICPRVTRLIQWDERLRFYGTDSYFMLQYERIRSTLYVTKSKLDHQLAMDLNPTREWRLNYARELIRCNNLIYNTFLEKLFNLVFNLWILVRSRIARS